MLIKDVQANQGNVDLVLTITDKAEIRQFEKFGRTGQVCNLTGKDDSGEINITLWNDDVHKVDQGDKIHIINGWCSEFRGEKQVSTGKFGQLEVLQKGTGTDFAPASEETAGSPEQTEALLTDQPAESSSDDDQPITTEERVI